MSLHRERKTRETKFGWIAQKAQENPDEVFTSLAHYLTEEYLLESFKKLRKKAANGLDGVGWYDYSQDLAVNISSLHKRLRDNTYQAPDIRRVWIDKGNGRQRPLGISCIEDKIVHWNV